MPAQLTRRTLFSAPLAAAVPVLPAPAAADPSPAVLAVLAELESPQDWQMGAVACAKAYTAYRLRQALGLALPDPKDALEHLHMQRWYWESYTRSAAYERDLREGKVCAPPPPDLEIGRSLVE
jgi:hypothetical protein